MGVDMSDFKLSFLGQRRRFGARAEQSPVDEMAEQIRSLDEAAQQTGRRIGHSARKLRARNRWHPEDDGDLLAELAETLVSRADGMRAECAALSALLERARRVIAADANGADGERPASEGVRLIATQMAIAGSTRAEIHGRLRDQFGIEDADPVLNEIFGVTQASAS